MQENWQTLQRLFGYYWRALRLVWRASPRYAFAATALGVISALAAPVQIWLTKVLIDSIMVAVPQQLSPVVTIAMAWSTLFPPVGALMVVLLLGEVGRRLAESSQQILRFQVDHYARCLLLEKAAHLDLAFYESSRFYDQLERAKQEFWRMMNLARLATDGVGTVLSLALTLALVGYRHPLAMVILLIVAIPRLLVDTRYAQDIFNLFIRQTQAQRMVGYLADLLVTRDAVKEIRLFGLQQLFLERFRYFWQNFFAETTAIIFRQERSHLLLLGLSALGAGAIWLFALLQATLGRITIGELILLIQAVDRVRTDLGDLFRRGGIFLEHSLFVGNFFDFLDLDAGAVTGALTRQETATPVRPFPPRLQQGIEFRHVSFQNGRFSRIFLLPFRRVVVLPWLGKMVQAKQRW